MLVSVLALGTSWYGASSTTDFVHQVSWLVLGMAAAGLLAFGAMTFLLDALREIRRRRAAVMRYLDAVLEDRPVLLLEAALEPSEVASDVMTHYHLPSCQLARGKATPLTGPAHAHRSAGRVPCGVCHP